MTHQKFLKLAKKMGFTNIQITIETVINESAYYINNALDDYSSVNKTTYNIKAEYNGKVEQAVTEYLDKSILELLIEKITLSDTNYENEFLPPQTYIGEKVIKTISPTRELNKIKDVYHLRKKYPLVKSIETFYKDEYQKTQIVNDKGADLSTSSHIYKFAIEAVANNDANSVSFNKSLLTTNKKNLDFSSLTNDTLQKAEILLNEEALTTNKYNIVIDSNVASSILLAIKNMISAKAIHQKTSCLTGKLNKKIASSKLTILEEPLNKDYPGYTAIDKEGTHTYNKDIVENGILKTYLYDTKEAKQDKLSSTGNNYGAISTRNMYIKPSNTSLDDLLKEMKDGLYITDKMGAIGTSINPTTGNISIQVFGFVVKNGQIIGGFKPAIMSTTIFELLENIEQIGADLTFDCKEAGSPSLYIKNISISA